MNIYNEVYLANKDRLWKRALSITMNDGTRREYSYERMFDHCERYAKNLIDAGVKTGDRIALVCEGSPEWTIAFFAILKINCTAVLIDSSLAGEEILDFVKNSDVRSAFISQKVLDKCFGIRELSYPIFDVYSGNIFKGSVTKVELGPTNDGNPEIAVVIYSSGTTRKAAGIMHSHDSLINTTRMTLKVQKLNDHDRFLAIIPNSHIYGVVCLVLGPHLVGGDVRYIESLTGEAVMNALRDYNPTVLSAVPKIYEVFKTQIMRKIEENPKSKKMFGLFFPICLKLRHKNGKILGKEIFSAVHKAFGGSIRVLCSAGAPMSKETAEFYYGLGFNILITYGASETNIPTIGNTPENLSIDSCGKPYPDVTVKIGKDDEILIKSPYMMKGYFRNEEATKEAFTEDGYFKSGDIGYKETNGRVHITGRLKDNIVLSTGKKITPDEVEKAYSNIEGIKELVVCGVPVKEKGYDEIHAFVVPEEDTDEGREILKKRVREKGAEIRHNLRVSKLHFILEVPKTALQKPKRYMLRKIALETIKEPKREESLIAGIKKEISIFENVAEIIAKNANTDASSISRNTKIFKELTIDSLGAINLAMDLEDEYDVNIEQFYFEEMTVDNLIESLEGKREKNSLPGNEKIDYPQKKDSFDYLCYSALNNFAHCCHNIEIRGKENLPVDCGFIICANHVSKIDYLYIASALGKKGYMKLCCMAKKELFRKDIFSQRLIKSTGMVPMDRGGMNKKSMQNLKARLQENWVVLIHPEGTRSDDGIFRTIKSGAATLAVDAGVPIVPVYIDGMFDIWPKGSHLVRSYDFKNRKKYKVTVTFGKAISSRNIDIKSLTDKIQNAILELQDEICTNPNYNRT